MSRDRRQRGLSLVELMLAMAVGLVLTAGVVGVFASSRATYQIQDDLSRLQESARFVFELLSRDLREAGFVGCNYDWTRLSFNAAPITQAISGIDGATLAGGGATTADRIAVLVTGGAGRLNSIAAGGGGVQMTVNPDADPAADPFQAGDFGLLTNCKWANVFQVATATENQNPQSITSTAAGAPASLLRYNTPGNPPARVFKTPLVVYQ
ncbi:MAG: prepilin-type N-terminal cleavage/methylation domain-containing protein, partial [Pseudomonadota bacterium]|nr:prepilin-type N-terminal cleavage/methylation domain-containing protein [Pseudomonadota bacterium]